MMLPLEKRPRRVDRFLGKDLGDEYLFYDSAGEQVHFLNMTAREIYLLCDSKRTVEEVIRAFAEMYDVDESTARRDATATIQRLLELGFLSLS